MNVILFLGFLKFIYFVAALGLGCCAWAFSSCGKQGPLLASVRGLLTAVAFPVAEHGLQVHGLQQLRHVGSVVVAHGLSCSVACGILPDQGSNSCPLHWQADSQPLCHQGSPLVFLIIAILTGVRQYFIVVSICISLKIRDVEHVFVYLLAICKIGRAHV